jgi:hypothetical protein
MIFRTDFFVCQRCESISSDSNAKKDDHKWWHSLLVLPKGVLKPVLKIFSNEVDSETTGKQAETQSAPANSALLRTDNSDWDTNTHSALISGVVTRISAVEDNFHVAHTAMENKVDSTRVALEGQLGSIDERVVMLDEKITELTEMLGDLIGRLNI